MESVEERDPGKRGMKWCGSITGCWAAQKIWQWIEISTLFKQFHPHITLNLFFAPQSWPHCPTNCIIATIIPHPSICPGFTSHCIPHPTLFTFFEVSTPYLCTLVIPYHLYSDTVSWEYAHPHCYSLSLCTLPFIIWPVLWAYPGTSPPSLSCTLSLYHTLSLSLALSQLLANHTRHLFLSFCHTLTFRYLTQTHLLQCPISSQKIFVFQVTWWPYQCWCYIDSI